MVFNDPRRFGLMRVGRGAEFAELGNVGRDPLDAAPSLDGVARAWCAAAACRSRTC